MRQLLLFMVEYALHFSYMNFHIFFLTQGLSGSGKFFFNEKLLLTSETAALVYVSEVNSSKVQV